MIFDTIRLAHFGLWVVNSIYCIGLLFQVIENYKIKSTRGLSDLMLLGYTIAYITQLFYIFCFDLPLSCKVIVPVCFMLVLSMVFQDFLYSESSTSKYILAGSYLVVFILSGWFTPYLWSSPSLCGIVTGVISTFMWSIFQIPQILKICNEKSTEGFSFSFVMVMSIGCVVELVSSLILNLPLISIVGITRGLLVYIIFYIQFFMYKNR